MIGTRHFSKQMALIVALATFLILSVRLVGASECAALGGSSEVKVVGAIQAISNNSTVSATVLHRLLNDSAFLSSVNPLLVQETRPSSRGGERLETTSPYADHLIRLQSRLITENMLNLSVCGKDARKVEQAATQLIEHLQALRLGELESVQQELELAREMHRADSVRLERVQEEVSRLRVECGGLDPHRWLQDSSNRYHQMMVERRDLSLDLSVTQGVRNHLAERLQNLRQRLTRQSKTSQNHLDLAQEVKTIQTEMDAIQNRLKASPSDTEAARDLTTLLHNLEAIQGSVRDGGERGTSVGSDTNTFVIHEIRRTENDLVQSERHIAETSARVEALIEMLELLRKEVLEFRRLNDRDVRLRDRIEELEIEVNRNRKGIRNLERDLALFDRPVIKMISGPTLVDGSR